MIRINLTTPTKACRDCGETKPLSEFHRHPQCRGGREHICKECRRLRSERWVKANPEKPRQYTAAYRAAHPESRARENDQRRQQYEQSPQAIRERNRAYYRAHKAKFLARNSRRRDLIKERTPGWADLKAIEAFYAACPPGFHVDHVIPLRGKTVSGLHVITNLQYLPATANLKKGNRLIA